MWGQTSGSVLLWPDPTGSDWVFIFPPNAGTNGQILSTDGVSAASWIDFVKKGSTSLTVTSGFTVNGGSVSCTWSITGNVATVTLSVVTGTSSGAGIHLSGLGTAVPAIIPSSMQYIPVVVQTSISTYNFGYALIDGAGNIYIYSDAAGSYFTSGQTVGLSVGASLVYPLY
jgi:hypothetical protein